MFMLYDANEDPFVPIFVGAVAFLNQFLYLHTMQKLANFVSNIFNCCQNISDKNPNLNMPNVLCCNIVFGKVAFKVKVSVFHKRHLTVKYTFSCRVKQRPLEYK